MPDPVETYLTALVESARSVLGDEFVGAYAAGSLALDAFQAGRSDVDIALVCRGPLSDAVKQGLIARLRHSALPCPARGLELVVYTEAAAGSGSGAPGFELELNDGPAMEFRQTFTPAERPAADGTFWYGLDRGILHQSGRVLMGPPAAQVFADVAPAELRDLLVTSLRWWMTLTAAVDDRPAEGADDAVLGACRALVRHREGVWLSKVDAGRRLVETTGRSTSSSRRLPHGPALSRPGGHGRGTSSKTCSRRSPPRSDAFPLHERLSLLEWRAATPDASAHQATGRKGTALLRCG